MNERIGTGRRERRVLARQRQSRDAQDPVPILVTGRIAVRRGQGQGQAGGELPPGARSGRGLVVSGRRETGPPGAFTLDPAEEGAGAAVDATVAERLAGLRVVQDLAVAEAGLAVLEDVEGGGFELGPGGGGAANASRPPLHPRYRRQAGEYGLDFGEVGESTSGKAAATVVAWSGRCGTISSMRRSRSRHSAAASSSRRSASTRVTLPSRRGQWTLGRFRRSAS